MSNRDTDSNTPAVALPTYLVQRGYCRISTFSGRGSHAIIAAFIEMLAQCAVEVQVAIRFIWTIIADYQITELEDQLASAGFNWNLPQASLAIGC